MSKIIITQIDDQILTRQDIVNIELCVYKLYKLSNPLFIVFNEDSILITLFNYLKHAEVLVIKNTWDSAEIRKRVEQKLLICNYFVLFYQDYNKAETAKLAAFDDYTLPKVDKFFEISLDMLRSL